MKPIYKILGLGAAVGCIMSMSSCGSRTKAFGSENITILPVEKLTDDFIMGVDISSLKSVESCGAKFFDARGNVADPLELLKEGGANCVRIRVWNNPNTLDGQTYGGGANDIDVAVELGTRATKLGYGVLIDFHYSDFWADPNKQTVPKAWAGMNLEEKKTALSQFTTDCLKKLGNAGVNLKMVQVGNEINNGMCGEILDPEVYSLVAAGAKAVRDYDKNIQIAVHYTDPLSDGFLNYKCSLLKQFNVDYDVLATSYYPYWHGDAEKLTVTLRKVSNMYHKKVMVAETSYPFTDEDGDGFGNVVSRMSPNQVFNYPFTVEGQAIAVRDVINAVANVKNGIGVFYWEPAWIPVCHYDSSKSGANEILEMNKKMWAEYGSGWATYAAREYDKEVCNEVNGGTWDNQAFFDFDGKVLDSINVWNYARNGSKGPLKVVRLESPKKEFAYGKKESLPETVKVTYNDGSVRDEKVEWNKNQSEKVLNNPDFGEYKVVGKISTGNVTECVVNVTASNFLVNGGFETGDLSGWTVINPLGKGDPRVDKNNQNAKEGIAYLTAWDNSDFGFDVTQELTDLSEGKYKCFASFQGTGVTNPSGTEFYVIVSRKDGTKEEHRVPVTIPNVWKNFFRAEQPVIKIDSNVSSVTVGAHISSRFDSASGANGSWIVMDDVNFLLAD